PSLHSIHFTAYLYLSSSTFSFFFHASRPHRILHSFPTRRSSDLHDEKTAARRTDECGTIHAAGGKHRQHVGEFDGNRVVVRVSIDRKSTRLNSSHDQISYAVFCLKKKKKKNTKNIKKQNKHTYRV